jgi:hypothetical protein
MKKMVFIFILFFIEACNGLRLGQPEINRIFFDAYQKAFSEDFLDTNRMRQIEPDTSLALMHESVMERHFPSKLTVQYVTLVIERDTILYFHYYYIGKEGCEDLPPSQFEIYNKSECTASGYFPKSSLPDK